jgi:hypothetical protein
MPVPGAPENPAAYISMLKQHHKYETKPGDLNLRLVMTEYELDRWYAHHTGIDIVNFPPYRPAHINK